MVQDLPRYVWVDPAMRTVVTVEKMLKAVTTVDIVGTKVAALGKALLYISLNILAKFTWDDFCMACPSRGGFG